MWWELSPPKNKTSAQTKGKWNRYHLWQWDHRQCSWDGHGISLIYCKCIPSKFYLIRVLDVVDSIDIRNYCAPDERHPFDLRWTCGPFLKDLQIQHVITQFLCVCVCILTKLFTTIQESVDDITKWNTNHLLFPLPAIIAYLILFGWFFFRTFKWYDMFIGIWQCIFWGLNKMRLRIGFSKSCKWFKIQLQPFLGHHLNVLSWKRLRESQHRLHVQLCRALDYWIDPSAGDAGDCAESVLNDCFALCIRLGSDFWPFHNIAMSCDRWLVFVSYWRCNHHKLAADFSSDFGYKILCLYERRRAKIDIIVSLAFPTK